MAKLLLWASESLFLAGEMMLSLDESNFATPTDWKKNP